jgi:hypothetical protein
MNEATKVPLPLIFKLNKNITYPRIIPENQECRKVNHIACTGVKN